MSISKTKHYFLMKRRYYSKKIQYFLMGHAIPLSPRDFKAFRTGPKVLAVSMPKAGTFLLRRVLKQLPCIAPFWTYGIDETVARTLKQLRTVRNGQLVSGHLRWSQELVDVLKSEGFRTLFIIRDLRDIIVSDILFVTYRMRAHPLHEYYKSLASDDERVMAWIVGPPENCFPGGVWPKAWERHTESMLPWLDQADCLTVRFEDLIGSRGGGSDEKQLETIGAIVKHIGIKLSQEELRQIAAKSFFTGSRTFRKGQIGDWRNHFTEEHKQIFKEVYGDTLIRLGYEKDYDW